MTPEQHHDIADKYASHAAFIYGTSNEDPSEHGTAQMAALATLALAHAVLALREPPMSKPPSPETYDAAQSLRRSFTRPPRMPNKMDSSWDDPPSVGNTDDDLSSDADPEVDNVYAGRNLDDESLVPDVDYPIDDDPDDDSDEAP